MLNKYMMPKYLVPVDEGDGRDDFSVLTDRSTIRNIIETICNTLHHPVTILDYNRLDLKSNDNNDYRIDSEIETYSLRYSCKLLRTCAGEDRCIMCDKFHAICMDSCPEVINDRIKKAVYDIPDFFYDDYVNNLPRVLNGYSRPVLEYYCPMLGYRELLFPINYSGNIIGVLFVGQILVESQGDKERINNTIDSFFSKQVNEPKNIFKKYIEIINKTKSDIQEDTIVTLIKKSDSILDPYHEIFYHNKDDEGRRNNYYKSFETQADYSHFIGKACTIINDIEIKFYEIFNNKQKEYFYKLIEEITNDFFEKYKNIQMNDTDKHKNRKNELEFVWKEISEMAEKIKKKFDFYDVIVFGEGNSVNIIESNKKRAYSIQNNKNKEWFYDFSLIDTYLSTAYDYTTSIDNPNILNGLSNNISRNNCIMVLFHDMVILIIPKSLDLKDNSYKVLLDAIGDNLSKINSIIALCTANFLKERHVLTLRMNRHESAHISTRLNDSMKRYFANSAQVFVDSDSEKQKMIVDDMQNTIKLISHMSNNIGLITGSINEKKMLGSIEKLDVFDLLYKWQIMFRNELKSRNLDIFILRNSDAEIRNELFLDDSYFYRDGPRYIYINSELFELLLYNLVDNAVKYAYRGSKIYLSWHKSFNDLFELTVTSFGPYMEEGSALYELYARGSTTQLHVATGDGIGLYAVKRIAQLLKLEVNHSSSFVSKYNLPLIPWYIKENFNPMYQKDYQMICSNMKQEIKESSCELIVNDNEYTSISRRDLSQEYLMKRICRNTWNTTFSVKVKSIVV